MAAVALAATMLLSLSGTSVAADGPDGNYRGNVAFTAEVTTLPDGSYSAYHDELNYTLAIDADYAAGQLASTPTATVASFSGGKTSSRSYTSAQNGTCLEEETTTYTPIGQPEYVGAVVGQPFGVGSELTFRVPYQVHKYVDRSGGPGCTQTPFDQTFNTNSTQQCLGSFDAGTNSIVLDHNAVPAAHKTCGGSLTGQGGGLDVRISPSTTAGPGGTFPLKVVLRNTSTTATLTNVTPVNRVGFGVANSYYPAGEQGEIQIVSGPQPAFPSTLAPGAQSEHTVTMKAVRTGKVGLEAKAAANRPGGTVTDTGYGEVEIGETQPTEGERTAMVATGGALFLDRAKSIYRQQQARYAQVLYNVLRGRLSDRAKKFYFGAINKLKITDYERALARWRGMAPELIAITTPNKAKLFADGNVYLNEEQFARFQQLHNAEMLRRTQEYFGGLADSVAKGVAYEARYWGQMMSTEGQGRIAADLALFDEANDETGGYLLAALKDSATMEGANRALDESDAALRSGFERTVNSLLAAREARIAQLTDLAETNPDGFIEQIANDTAGLGFEGFKLIAEEMMGEGAFRFAGKVFTGARAAIGKFTDAIGVSTPTGAKALAKATPLAERTATLGPGFLEDLDEDAKAFIALRKMADLGGMPLADVELTKEIVAKVNKRLKALGYDVEIEVLFRPANPYKVEGAFAKVETVGVKNVAPIDLALGAPPETLAETAIFKPRDPKTLPGWDSYSELERKLLEDRFDTRLSEYRQFHGLEKVTDKKMKAMLKAFDKTHTFDEIGKGREIKMKLSKEKVGDATVLKYDYLEVEGKKLIGSKDGKPLSKTGGKPKPIGTDFDQAAIVDKNTRQLLKGQPAERGRGGAATTRREGGDRQELREPVPRSDRPRHRRRRRRLPVLRPLLAHPPEGEGRDPRGSAPRRELQPRQGRQGPDHGGQDPQEGLRPVRASPAPDQRGRGLVRARQRRLQDASRRALTAATQRRRTPSQTTGAGVRLSEFCEIPRGDRSARQGNRHRCARSARCAVARRRRRRGIQRHARGRHPHLRQRRQPRHRLRRWPDRAPRVGRSAGAAAAAPVGGLSRDGRRSRSARRRSRGRELHPVRLEPRRCRGDPL